MRNYFGTYHRFGTLSKKEAAQLLSADNIVGDIYDIEDEIVNGEHRAWMLSRFDKPVGFFSEEFSRKLSVLAASGFVCKAILSFVAFSEGKNAFIPSETIDDDPSASLDEQASDEQSTDSAKKRDKQKGKQEEDNGYYWGEAAIICYDASSLSAEECLAFENFIAGVSNKIAEGVRPKLELDENGITKILDTKGSWLPSQTMPSPEKIKGSAILKQRAGMLDKVVEQGRSRNIGCYILSWLFLLAIVALIVWIFI